MTLPLQLVVYLALMALVLLVIRWIAALRCVWKPCDHCKGTGKRRHWDGNCMHWGRTCVICEGKGRVKVRL